jgi:signal transduction histidine kinase
MLSQRQHSAEHHNVLISKISSSSERMANLIHGLLDFSRLLKSEALIQTVNLNTIVSSVVNDFELAIQEKDAQIYSAALPVVEGIALQMNQLFYNLIGNALKFCRTDVKPQISVTSIQLAAEQVYQYIPKPVSGIPYYEISVTDNGIGFEPEYSDQIFEIFKRLHSRDLYPGSGIGLSLCRRIIANHHGHMQANSILGKGTTFVIILPGKQTSG